MPEILKVSFGGEQPPDYEYKRLANGLAAVWLYRNAGQNEDGEWSADGVYLETMLSEEDILSVADRYFATPEPEVTVQDLIEAVNILTDMILGGM